MILSFRVHFQSAPFDKREEADKKRQEMAIGNSDHMTLLKSYKVFWKILASAPINNVTICETIPSDLKSFNKHIHYQGWLETMASGMAAGYHYCRTNFLSMKTLQVS